MVTQTSIEAYHSQNLAPQREVVAREILRLTKAGQKAYIGLVARNLKMERSSVSGRWNDLKDIEIWLDGHRYELVLLSDLVRDPVTAVRVQAWAMKLISAPQGEQTALFQ